MSFRHWEERSLRRSNLAFNLRLLRQPFELPRNDITKADTVPPALLMYFQDG